MIFDIKIFFVPQHLCFSFAVVSPAKTGCKHRQTKKHISVFSEPL
jgi:hypothetical protein